MRTSEVKRKTAETDIALTLNLDGSGASKIDSGCGFLDICSRFLQSTAALISS